jgi:hypothetical protein
MANQQRPKRQRQAKVFFDERETYSQPPRAKKTKKIPVEVLETKAAEEPPPESVQTLLDAPVVAYDPPCRVSFTPIIQCWPERDPFSLFIKFLGEASLTAIVCATNARATAEIGPLQKHARRWHPLTYGELLCWLGLLFYMANHTMTRRPDYWSISGGVIREFMSETRWEQIHRYLTFNCDNEAGEGPDSSFFDKLEPVSSLVRASCRQAALPSSWLTVDEAMTAFKGRSSHTVKMPGKPISEGYKIWVLCCRGGYIIDWLYYSRSDGTQSCTNKQREYLSPVPYRWRPLAETFEVPVLLMERLVARIPHQKWLLFLDNLFLTVELAHILLQMGIGVMGTTRKDRKSIPRDLRNIKQLNTALVYGTTLSVLSGWVLCFAYQDNNTVLGITTAYSLHRPTEDWVIKDKWRPKTSSTN